MGNSKLTLVSQPQDYFRELVRDALQSQNLATQPEAEFYLVNLLNSFMIADHLHLRDASGEVKSETLVSQLQEALEEPQARAQASIFKRLGDTSLYTAGFFQESLNRKLVDVDYYIEMGEAAYKNVALLTDEEVMKPLFKELSDKFANFVDVLGEISEKTSPKTEQDILRVYELWVRTKSGRAAKTLKQAGILPNGSLKKDWQ